MNRSRLRQACLLSLVLTALAGGYQAIARRPQAVAPLHSQVTSVEVAGSQAIGTFHGVGYKRTWGTLTGSVASNENVQGLASLPTDRSGSYRYKAEFEWIAPLRTGTNSVVVVEVENRGSPVLLEALHEVAAGGAPSTILYPAGMGNGFLFEHDTSYARVQWQYGVAAGVPQNAEGVGEVMVRDFGRLLSGKTKIDIPSQFDPGAYRTLVLAGISQSGFFINTFLAEGFNQDPATGGAVFDGAIAVDGTGNWLALNQLAAQNKSDEYPYLVPDGTPLEPGAVLRRPRSDPFYIDIANYTDFYRLRASLTDAHVIRPAQMRRYDWPSPHARAGGRRGVRLGKCNGGEPTDLNPISYTPYLRAVTLGLERVLGVPSAKNFRSLPPTTLFTLGPAPPRSATFNSLSEATLEVPITDPDEQPVGGVRFPEVEHPLGKPLPVSLPPVLTTSISETCGNLGGWQPMTASELAKRYGSQSNYMKLYGASLDKLMAEGYLLPADRVSMLENAKSNYEAP